MSRVGSQPITLPSGTSIEIDDGAVTIKGPKGSLIQAIPSGMRVAADSGTVTVTRPSDERGHRALHGLTRSLLANMVQGVTEGYTKALELVGVGYRVQQSGKGITLSVMFSHTVDVQPRDGITLDVEGNNRIHVRGIDKQMVGQTAAEIRSVRRPNAYTGKGVRYAGEQVRLKPGKSARRVL